MKRQVVTTADGSKTIRIEDWDEHYHSTHGAIQEALHVYIQAGLEYFSEQHQPKSIRVLEAGYGTGLNALLACLWSQNSNIEVDYSGMEAFPISEAERRALDYPKRLEEAQVESIYEQLHLAPWEEWSPITKTFRLKKQKLLFSELELKNEVDVVFYDAFGPRVQPELWEKPIFERFYEALKPEGVLVTYSVKGTARRALQALGFEVDIIEGPPGKRHMMRAYKPC
ncbi:tRNA (5-methylaminomethyl-2-thiouridine)(34)-methyltransferase MnmD [Psychroflexus sp. YR1-1]|uniref:tRNA (5-methylaminomethyl-2-thiouridine)(34)-methyltransferase MnmD n=1 Tax=Psychroflexus aurantiacus TaxID=2709310 RepID=A0A6B3R053_9FLAO|nr:tRNA (5-methylaminomethyl-2-thiouridine)(34)-methyltransferase MnmD [Psychroflexus aurantiacus]NEV93916.1 tRNA (5-methylaminomethyl-2-thiouridine)(34)-methyltransferase MnmD [Psychroflexus aurantiacus]